jgi:glycosyltransferase 2 family protein
MSEAARAITRAVHKRVGWNRIGVAISLLIVIIAAVALVRLSSDIEPAKIIAALKAKVMQDVLLAAAFVACGLITLSAYDWFALRTIGKDAVPYRVALFASFTSYTIGHNLGATVFTAGAIRFRIYSAWGLTILDVAKIGFVTGLTFWLGNAFVLGCGMSYAPAAASAINQLPEWINRAIGLLSLTLITVYLLWLMPRPRIVGPPKLQIVLPNARMTLAQIGIGALDLSASTAAMYALLPAHPGIDLINLLVIFVTALLLGFFSHAPGSLGVIEAAMLVGLPQFKKEELLASLLMFRMLYFLLPMALAVALLGLRELLLVAKGTRFPRLQ